MSWFAEWPLLITATVAATDIHSSYSALNKLVITFTFTFFWCFAFCCSKLFAAVIDRVSSAKFSRSWPVGQLSLMPIDCLIKTPSLFSLFLLRLVISTHLSLMTDRLAVLTMMMTAWKTVRFVSLCVWSVCTAVVANLKQVYARYFCLFWGYKATLRECQCAAKRKSYGFFSFLIVF